MLSLTWTIASLPDQVPSEKTHASLLVGLDWEAGQEGSGTHPMSFEPKILGDGTLDLREVDLNDLSAPCLPCLRGSGTGRLHTLPTHSCSAVVLITQFCPT